MSIHNVKPMNLENFIDSLELVMHMSEDYYTISMGQILMIGVDGIMIIVH